jgi:hypothetical protein
MAAMLTCGDFRNEKRVGSPGRPNRLPNNAAPHPVREPAMKTMNASLR